MTVAHDALDTLELYVTRHDAASDTYKVNVTLEGGRMFDGLLRLDTLPMPPPPGNDATIRAYGNTLFKRLFAGSLDNAFYQAWAAAQAKKRGVRVRLWLDNVNDTKLHMVPWELLHYHPSGNTASEPVPLTIANQSAFSRYLASSEYEGKPLERLPIRMLIVVSDPADAEEAWGLKPIGKQAIQNTLDLLFQPIRSSHQLEYHFLSPTDEKQVASGMGGDGNGRVPATAQQSFPASAQRLQEALHVQYGYDIVLYFGHALVHPKRGTRLLLEDHATGQGRIYDGSDLVRLLKQASHRPSLIILMACNTAVALPTPNTSPEQKANSNDSNAAEQASTASLAAQLVQQGGIPSVIAMQRPMPIDAGRTFTYRLCVRLLQHGVVDIAVNAARQFVFKPNGIDWSTPVLYMRMQDGRLFSTLPQMSYAQKILSNPTFMHWKGPEFINRDVIIVPAGQEWTIVRKHPEDAPSSQDALQIMKQLLIQHIQQTIDEERTHATIQEHQQWYTQVLDKPPLPNVLAFVGYPHSGLTVIMMRATIDLAEAAINVVSKVGLLHRPIGIFVKLRDYETQRISNRRMERLIIETATDVEPDLGKTLSRIFEQSATTTHATPDTRERFVFLLDGLDDITESHRQIAAEQITELAERLPQHLFAVSCNSYVFHSRMLRKPKMLIILPLNERQVLRYLRRRNPDTYRELYRQIVECRLLNMTTDPDMMNVIYERITQDDVTTMSRNQLAHDYLSRMLQSLPALYEQGDVARRTLIALAWESRWQHKDTLPIQDVFAVMAQVRKERDYSLEDLYQKLQESYLILNIGQYETRFLLPTLQAYSAALALVQRPDIAERLEDIFVMCSSPKRLRWWEETIYTLVELLPNPALLFQKLVTFTRYNSSPHILLAARALEALPDKVEHLMDKNLRQELLDACILQLDVAREPSTERRANIVTALGRVYLTNTVDDDNITAQLGNEQIKNKLIQLLTQPVRQTPNGPRYEYTTVRIAAARALYTRYALLTDYVGQTQADTGTLYETSDVGNLPMIISAELDPLLRAWKHHDRDELGRIFRCAEKAPERAIAAFALGDLAYNADVKLLLDMVVCPQRMQSNETSQTCDITLLDDWSDTCWAAADSLTLFDAMQVSFQLSRIFQDGPEPSEISVQPLIYLVGRVRLRDVHAIRWLIGILKDHPDFAVKAKALQSLAWVCDALDRLDEPVPELETLLPKDEVLQKNRPQGLVAVLRRVFEYIVFWDKKKLSALVGVSEDEMDTTTETQEQQQAVRYVCRKAIEALTWIGDSTTIAHIQPRISELTPELREYWYTAAAAITSRMDSCTYAHIDAHTYAHIDAHVDFHS